MIKKIWEITKIVMNNRKNVTKEERKIVVVVLLLTMIPILINCFYSAYLFKFENQNIFKTIIETIVLNSVVFSAIYASDKDIQDYISNLSLKNGIIFLFYLIYVIITSFILNLFGIYTIDMLIKLFESLRIEVFDWMLIILNILKNFFIIFSIGIILFDIIIFLNYILLLLVLKFIKKLRWIVIEN